VPKYPVIKLSEEREDNYWKWSNCCSRVSKCRNGYLKGNSTFYQ